MENIKTKKHSPVLTMIIIILIVSFLSLILAMFKFDGTKTIINNGLLENSIVVVKNIFSREGIIHLLNNTINNFNTYEPFLTILLSLASISLLKACGFLKHIFSPLKKVNPKLVTFSVILISVLSTAIGDYSYIIMLPLVCVLYQYLGKSPVLGILSVFLGITLGYGTGLFYNYNDYALGILTQSAATIEVDSSYKFSLSSSMYIMLFSTITISILMTILIENKISKKIKVVETYEDDVRISKKGLILSSIVLVILLGIFIFMLKPNGILLDNTQEIYVAKIFSPTAPFNISFMLIFLLISSIISMVYGFVSRNFKSNHEFTWAFTKELNNVGYLFILLLLSSILITIIDWTNLGLVLASNLISIISHFDFTGIVLIFISFVFIILMSFLIPNSIEKWSLISPILVPVFMRGNLTPDFAQFVFKSADSVGKILTPIFIYWVVMIGFIQKYNKNKNLITYSSTLKLIWPIIVTMIIFWILLLILWYVAGLPLGIDTLVTM